MKNSKNLVKILLLSAFVIFMLMFTACVKPPQALTAPTNVRIENGILMWDEVEGADEYIVYTSYNGEEVVVKTNECDLSFIQKEGEYKVDVAAVKQEKNSKTQTKWVGTQYNYVKQSNTPGQATAGLNFTKIEGINAYEVSMGNADLKGTVVIPESYNNLPVIKIAEFAFCYQYAFPYANVETGEGCNTVTKKFVLPDTIEEIGSYAFAGCIALTDINLPIRLQKVNASAFAKCIKLSSVTLPLSLREIGNGAFSECAFAEITIPSAVESIGFSAFSYCNKLIQIKLPDKVTVVEDGLFRGCTSLQKVELSEKTEQIGASAFLSCKQLKQINLPNTLKSIGGMAFYECESLAEINLPNSIETIGDMCFYGTVWYNNQPDGLIINDKFLYEYKGEIPLNGVIVVPQNVEKIIKEDVFVGSKINKIIFQNAIPYIPKETFKNCTQLTEVVLPNGVTKICEYAFENTGITNLDFLPSSVQIIESGAFQNSSLQSASLPNNAVLAGDGVFKNCKNLISANIYNGTNLPSFTFYGCEKLKEVTLNNGITEINKNAFKQTGIENLDFLTSNITAVDSYAFAESSLKSATLPKGTVLTGDNVFNNCKNLTYVNVQGGLTLPKNTFIGCEKLTEVVLSEGIESIGESAFSNTAIINVDFLPTTLKSIEKSAFSSSGLTSVTLKEGVQMQSMVFSDCTSLKTARLPSDLKVIPGSLFSGCSSLSEVGLSEGLEEVQSRAFYKCAIKNLDFLPSTVKTIGRSAFSFCPIEEIRYPKALQSSNNIFSANLAVKTHILPVVLTKLAFRVQAENLYYEGTQDQFAERYPTSIGNGIDVSKIKIHFYIENKDDIDDLTKSYWHYAEDGKTPVVWEL